MKGLGSMAMSEFNYKSFKIISECEVSISETAIRDDYRIFKISAYKCDEKTNEIKIEWAIPCCDIMSQWNPNFDIDCTLRPAWDPVKVKSRTVFTMPIQTHIGAGGNNRCTVALSDAKTLCEIRSGVYEEDACIHYKLILYPEQTRADYEILLLIDTRNIPFYEAINDVRKWWTELGYDIAYVPVDAKLPMYSTWYAMHQNLNEAELLSELQLAREYGMKAVIIDDGWQTEDNNRGYAYCGDWKLGKNKISDMKKFVGVVHSMGMKCILWYSVPLAGIYSEALKIFSDKILKQNNKACYVLDPRYKEVRQYLSDIYERAVKEWDLDGLKLDFMDSFQLGENDEIKGGMDIVSLEDAICALFDDIKKRLTLLNPDIMIELRQNYVGPEMLKYGNILRVADCPADVIKNRVCGINLRLTSGGNSVHSDMLMWNYKDSVESAAQQIINVLFLVPQISMKLEKLSAEHKKMLKFYMDLIIKYRKCLQEGKIKVYNPESNYSLVSTQNETHLVAVAYSNYILKTDIVYDELIFVNGTCDDTLIIDNLAEKYNVEVTIFNCMGESKKYNSVIEKGLNIFNVRQSGVLKLTRLK